MASVLLEAPTVVLVAGDDDERVCHYVDVERMTTFCGKPVRATARLHRIVGNPHPCACGRRRCPACEAVL